MRRKVGPLKTFVVWLVLIAVPCVAVAGPPFKTDDPDTLGYGCWEFDFAAQYFHDRNGNSATLPHLEANYGFAPNWMIHAVAPFQYVKPEGQPSQYGYGDKEVGIKYRFIEETASRPQVATFPLLEIPTGDASRGLGDGKTQFFLPLWLQKSWGPWTTYGGGGYHFTSGEGSRDWWFFGWQLQREITKKLAVGAEVYYSTPSTAGVDESKGYTVGAIINLTDRHHVMFSAGQDVYGPNYYNFYVGYQLTFGP